MFDNITTSHGCVNDFCQQRGERREEFEFNDGDDDDGKAA